jgi:hypothetical protein
MLFSCLTLQLDNKSRLFRERKVEFLRESRLLQIVNCILPIFTTTMSIISIIAAILVLLIAILIVSPKSLGIIVGILGSMNAMAEEYNKVYISGM